MNFLDYYLQRKITSGNVSGTSNSTEFSLTDPGQTQMGKAEQFEGENMSLDQEMEGGGGGVTRSSHQHVTEEGKDKN
jgi:hypothetical protein